MASTWSPASWENKNRHSHLRRRFSTSRFLVWYNRRSEALFLRVHMARGTFWHRDGDDAMEGIRAFYPSFTCGFSLLDDFLCTRVDKIDTRCCTYDTSGFEWYDVRVRGTQACGGKDNSLRVWMRWKLVSAALPVLPSCRRLYKQLSFDGLIKSEVRFRRWGALWEGRTECG